VATKKPKSGLQAGGNPAGKTVVVPYSLRTPWRDALRLELSRADGPSGLAIDRIARIVVNQALLGDMDCIYEIANRLDGKAAVQDLGGNAEGIQKLVVEWGSKVIEHKAD